MSVRRRTFPGAIPGFNGSLAFIDLMAQAFADPRQLFLQIAFTTLLLSAIEWPITAPSPRKVLGSSRFAP